VSKAAKARPSASSVQTQSRPLFSLRDGKSPFHLEPGDVAAEIEENALRHLTQGKPGLLERLVPAIEREAIARMAQQCVVTTTPTTRPNWMAESEWLAAWQGQALIFVETSDAEPESTPWAAAQVLLRARDLREAIDTGQPEKAAALAMLLCSWVFVGGIGVKYAKAAPVAERFLTSQREKSVLPRAAIRKAHAVETDSGAARKRDLVQAAMRAAGPPASTPEVWPHLLSELDAQGFRYTEHGAKNDRCLKFEDANQKECTLTYKRVQALLRELRGKALAGGRPLKKG
jgi:hypothetical protein